jgi:hypothetical protein
MMRLSTTDWLRHLNFTKRKDRVGKYSTMVWRLGFVLEQNKRKIIFTSACRNVLNLLRKLVGFRIMALDLPRFPWE